jgi:SagB-type dehydrogenase family enzyme
MLDVARILTLPKLRRQRMGSMESCIQHRRSVRSFRDEALTFEEFGQLLWATQGLTDVDGKRSAPSAGALYPLETSVAVGNVAGVDAGVYRYSVPRHALVPVTLGDQRKQLVEAADDQEWIATASAVVCIAALFARTTDGDRGRGYVFMEAGLAAASMMLQAVGLGLGATMIGAFNDDAVARVLHLAAGELPLCLIPVGRPC